MICAKRVKKYFRQLLQSAVAGNCLCILLNYFPERIAACAAAKRAMGTRNGLQET